jgi:hypothetical protein
LEIHFAVESISMKLKLLLSGILICGFNLTPFAQDEAPAEDSGPPPVYENDPKRQISPEVIEQLKTLASEAMDLIKKNEVKGLELKSREMQLLFARESVHWKRAARPKWKVVDKALNDFIMPFQRKDYKIDAAAAQKFHDAFIEKLTTAAKAWKN